MLPLVSVPTPSAGKGEREKERVIFLTAGLREGKRMWLPQPSLTKVNSYLQYWLDVVLVEDTLPLLSSLLGF